MSDPTPADITNRWFKIIGVLALLVLGVTQTPLLGWLADVQAGATISVGTYLNASPISQSLEDNLLAHWTFDGPDVNWADTSSEIKDRSANNNHGNTTASMSSQTSTVRGPVGQAMLFADSTDYINFGSGAPLNNLFSSNDNKATIVFWAYVDDEDGDVTVSRSLIDKRSTRGWQIYMDSGTDRLRFLIDTESQPGIWSINVPFNEWFQVAIAYDGTEEGNSPDMYLNGVLQSETRDNNRLGTSFSDVNYPMKIGESDFSGAFKGAIDDVRIYDNFFTAEQAQYLYDSTKPAIMATTPQPTGSLEDGLVGHWTFDGPDINWGDTASEIKDRSGQNHHGNSFGINQSSPVKGKIGQALEFNGVDDYVDLNADVVNDEADFTISAWFRAESIGEGVDRTIVGLNSDSHTFYLYFDDDGFLKAYASRVGNDNNKLVIDSTLDTDTWYHALISHNENLGTTNAYVNGVKKVDSATFEFGGPSVNHVIGGINSSRRWDGQIDDVRFYNKVLSDDEVSRLYQQGSGVTINAEDLTEPPEPSFTCGTDTVSDVDGNEYSTVAIGTQCWMAENMRVGTTVNISTTQTDNSTIERWCFNNDDANCDTNLNPNNPDGGLYQWNEAMQYSSTEGAQGICPAGWHIPTDDEYKTLEMHLGMSQAQADGTGYRGTDEGTQLKPNGSSGFEGNLAGGGFFGSFYGRGSGGYFWSSSESGSSAWSRSLASSESRVGRNSSVQTYGLSVRCVQNS